MNEQSLQVLFSRVVLLMPLFSAAPGCGGSAVSIDDLGHEGGRDGWGGSNTSGESNGGALTMGGRGSGGAANGGAAAGGMGSGGTLASGGSGDGGADWTVTGGAAATGGAVATGGIGGVAGGGTGGGPSCTVPQDGFNCAAPHAAVIPSACVTGGVTPAICKAICGPSIVSTTCEIFAKSDDFVTITCPPTCVAGRRPPGWRERQDIPLELGAYWARMAELESASVLAFRGLGLELRALGAPRALLRALRRAGRDERRHARATRALSRRFGARPPEVRAVDQRARSIESIACDNVAEGCVRELYGALVATYQARAARDPQLAAVMMRIARDETRHAALSVRVQRWLEQRLDAGARARVAATKHSAARQLRRDLTTAAELPRDAGAGLPSRAEATRLFDSIADVFFG